MKFYEKNRHHYRQYASWRRSPLIAEWFAKNLPQAELTYDIIDLADFDLPFLDESEMPQTGTYHHETTKRWSEKIATYAGFIFIVPQYNWGYPAVLKNALDYLYREWQGNQLAWSLLADTGALKPRSPYA